LNYQSTAKTEEIDTPIPTSECKKCGRENSHKTIKCVECGHMFYTNEELAARHPMGRGGYDWGDFCGDDGEVIDVAEDYKKEVGTEWLSDASCASRDAWVAPDGTFWPCGREQHRLLAPVLVAHYDLYGQPRVRETEGLGGCISTDEYGRKYYEEYVDYPGSVDILKDNGFIELGHPAFQWDQAAAYYRVEPTEDQRETLERWREVCKIDRIRYYD
jgi:hypothetical protein